MLVNLVFIFKLCQRILVASKAVTRSTSQDETGYIVYQSVRQRQGSHVIGSHIRIPVTHDRSKDMVHVLNQHQL